MTEDGRGRGESRGPFSLSDTGLAILLVALLLAAYWPALTGGFLWDDDAHVTREALRSWDGLRQIWFNLGATQQYYPILHSAFWLQARLWGENVVGYHVVNLALHCADALLLVVVCRRLEIPGAWLAAFLFALHPVHVETVAWISEEKNTLSLLFYLLAALAYLRFDRERSRGAWAAATVLFVLALLTKTVTATLPAALLVVFWWKRGRIERRDVTPLLPWFAMAAAGGLFTAWVEQHLIGAEGAEFALAPIQRVFLAGRVVDFYLWKLVWPSQLIFSYPRWIISPADSRAAAYVGEMIALTIALWLTRRFSRAPLAAFLFFVGSLFPVLGFFNVYPFRYSFVADHFQYLPSIGVIVLAAAGISIALAHATSGQARRVGWIGAGALVGLLALITSAQSRMYTSAEVLYRVTILHNPDSWMSHQNLGRMLLRSPGGRDEAIREFRETLRLKPDHARAHFSLAVALADSGNVAEAIAHYEAAVRFEPANQVLVRAASDSLAKLRAPR